jgi:hypothetical protein
MQTPTAMTLGNMRANAVRTLAVWCLGRGCTLSQCHRCQPGTACSASAHPVFDGNAASCAGTMRVSPDPCYDLMN